MTRPSSALARRYARALFDVADARSSKAALELRDELRSFAAELEAHAALRRALAHPALGSERKRRVVTALAERAKATPLVLKLVELLAQRDRLELFGDVARAYADVVNAAKGVVMAEVISAVPLAAAQHAGAGCGARRRGQQRGAQERSRARSWSAGS